MSPMRETQAGHARLLHQQVKAAWAELQAQGYPIEANYMVLMSVVMRLAYETDGENGIAILMTVLRGGD